MSPFIPLLLSACTPDKDDPNAPQVNLDFARANFYDAPFPNADLFDDDGTVDLSGFPNPDAIALVEQARGLLEAGAHGTSLAAGVFFTLNKDLPAADLPAMADTITPTGLAQLIDLDTGERVPLQVSMKTDGGPFGAPHLLTLLPLQGRPMHPGSHYAAILLRYSGDTSILRPSDNLTAIVHGDTPAGMPAHAVAAYADALDKLPDLGVDPKDLAGLAVFTTDNPAQGLYDKIAAATPPALPAATDFTAVVDYDRYCVKNAVMTFDDYQSGTPPYQTEGGGWADTVQRQEQSRMFVTVPKGPMPAGGWPLVLLVRTGAGADDALADRGVQEYHGGPSIVAGSGPADEFAKMGWAGVQVDSVLGGIRNPTGTDEEFLVYNFLNGEALRDNIRESALELDLLAPELADLHVPDCDGGTATFNTDHLVLMGHSMGASIAVPTVAGSDAFKGVIMSGAGASFIDNLVYKTEPLAVLPIAVQMTQDPNLDEFDPVSSFVQWSEEPAEAMVYAPDMLPRQVLVFQGIADHYIPPPIANALDLAIPVDLAGPALDAETPETAVYPSLASLLTYSGRSQLDFPIQGNVDGSTAVVAQFPSDGIEDGHEVMWQTEPPKMLYRCFLKTILDGAPVIVDPNGDGCP